MRVLRGSDAGEWLKGRIPTFGGRVRDVAGEDFESYVRVMHPLRGRRLDWSDRGSGMVPSVVDERRWTWAELASALGRTAHPLMQWHALAREAVVRWGDGWEVDQPEQGAFEPELFARLVPALLEATSTPDDAVVGFWTGSSGLHPGGRHVVVATEAAAGLEATALAQLPMIDASIVDAIDAGDVLALPGREYVLLGGALAELADPDWGFAAGVGWWASFRDPTPQLVWPRDHAWLVATEVDFDSTLVAGARGLIDAVVAVPGLESFEVGPDDDLTSDGDVVNR
ncbi:hypothetical protein [Demequina subtropica]|uniref:hypothetical protein n=1 Tax=Demequina subtropica TaxID=1638989 RepID=UPI000B31AE26|nr:hypothetical protein [Demequina subtropica]